MLPEDHVSQMVEVHQSFELLLVGNVNGLWWLNTLDGDCGLLLVSCINFHYTEKKSGPACAGFNHRSTYWSGAKGYENGLTFQRCKLIFKWAACHLHSSFPLLKHSAICFTHKYLGCSKTVNNNMLSSAFTALEIVCWQTDFSKWSMEKKNLAARVGLCLNGAYSSSFFPFALQ